MLRCIIIVLFSNLCYAQHEQIIEQAVYPNVAKAIYIHESNNGKSKLATRYNNVYGFKGGERKIGRTSSKYSIYKNKEDSVLDYLDFEKKLINKHKLNTKEKYLLFLSKRYAYDKFWLKRIRKLI